MPTARKVVSASLRKNIAALSDASVACPCDGSCEFGCVGDDDRPSLHANRVLCSWLEHASGVELASVAPHVSRAVERWEPHLGNADASKDLLGYESSCSRRVQRCAPAWHQTSTCESYFRRTVGLLNVIQM